MEWIRFFSSIGEFRTITNQTRIKIVWSIGNLNAWSRYPMWTLLMLAPSIKVIYERFENWKRSQEKRNIKEELTQKLFFQSLSKLL